MFYYKTVFILTLLIFFHYPDFSIITNHCINNDQHNDLCHEAWSLDLVSTKCYLPSHLGPAKILCSSCELCTNDKWQVFKSSMLNTEHITSSFFNAPLSFTEDYWLCFFCYSFQQLRLKDKKKINLISSIPNEHCFIHLRRTAQKKSY